MSRFMVAGFVQFETIVKVDSLPVPYLQFQSIPDMIDTNIGGCGYNESMALKWLGNEVDFMSMIGKDLKTNEMYKKLMVNDVELSFEYVLPRLDSMPSSVILYNNGKKQILLSHIQYTLFCQSFQLFIRKLVLLVTIHKV